MIHIFDYLKEMDVRLQFVLCIHVSELGRMKGSKLERRYGHLDILFVWEKLL